MKPFFDHDFLLTTPTAKMLFQSVAELPIVDCFTKLNPEDIAGNRQFQNITEFLLDQDPKKQQAMRAHGIDEYYITGESGAFERFQKWAETLPCLIGNPLYHQAQMELQRYFSVSEPLSPATAEAIWNRANQKIQSGSLSVFEILKRFHVKELHTPQDPADALLWHQKIADEGLCPAKVNPAFCADYALSANSVLFPNWIAKLEESCSATISNLAELQACLVERLLFFKSMGAKATTQTVTLPKMPQLSYEIAETAFQKAKSCSPLTEVELAEYQGILLSFLAKKYQDYGFTMTISSHSPMASRIMISLLEQLQKEHKLPKILICAKEPSQYQSLVKEAVSSEIAGSIKVFIKGMCYRKDALLLVLKSVAKNGIFPDFIGFFSGEDGLLSYPSQEYFRRILCEYLGSLVESGEYPNYTGLLKKFAQDIASDNARLSL